jgi:uncharacterized membrane protein (DUF2068 family)
MKRLIALDRAVHCAVLAVLGGGALTVAGRPELGVVLLAYAAAEGVEAAGLWRRRRWAEYMTFAVTASLLPLELALVWERPTALRIGALLVNAAVAAYLGHSVVRGRQMQ